MNRSILIVICDFLLVSLLAFSTVDINKTTNEGVPRQVKTTIATNQIDSRQDLAAVMRLALEQERKGRELLLGELAKTREAAGQQRGDIVADECAKLGLGCAVGRNLAGADLTGGVVGGVLQNEIAEQDDAGLHRPHQEHEKDRRHESKFDGSRAGAVPSFQGATLCA